MTTSAWKAKFERLAHTRRIDPALSGSREVVTVRRGPDQRAVDSVAAIVALRETGLGMLRAKRAIETVLSEGAIVVELPRVADAAKLEGDLAANGFAAKVHAREALDVAILRDRLGLTQEQFATRFGLEVDTIRNWEHGRRFPDSAARSLLRVIARFPEAVAEAQDS